MAIIVIAKNGVENENDPVVPTQVYLEAFCVFAFSSLCCLRRACFCWEKPTLQP